MGRQTTFDIKGVSRNKQVRKKKKRDTHKNGMKSQKTEKKVAENRQNKQWQEM